MIKAGVYRIPMNGPGDFSGLIGLVENGTIDPHGVIAVLAKTEGNGCVNDFSRGYGTLALKVVLSELRSQTLEEVEEDVVFIMSGGTEGVLSPHATVFTRTDSDEVANSSDKSLSVSSGHTRAFRPEEIGTVPMVQEVAKTVSRLMEEAGIKDSSDVHFVQIKCPLLTSERIRDAETRGEHVVTENTYKSMGFSRGASALGVAVALGEVKEDAISQEVIAKDWSLYSSVASTSAGVELTNCEIMVLGNSTEAESDYLIGHGTMEDSIDLAGFLEALRNSGLDFKELPSEDQKQRVVNVYAKAEADPSGYVRNRRTTMLTDDDINHTRHARAVVGAVVASVVGDPLVYVSGGAEHQGPSGGGPVAAIVRR